jgi:hypothetical protein
VDVLEDQHRGLVSGHGLDKASDREEQDLAVGDRPRWVEAEDDSEMLRDLLRLRRRQQRRDCIVELLRRSFHAVGLEDPAELLELERKG